MLHEGKTEGIALPEILTNIDPYWTVLDISIKDGGGSKTFQKFLDDRAEGRCVITIVDGDARAKPEWKRMVADKYTFILQPDFEGLNVEYFAGAIHSMFPRLTVNTSRFREIMDKRIKEEGLGRWGGTLEGAFREYLREILSDEEKSQYRVTKTALAPLLAKEMLKGGLPSQLREALNALLDVASGRKRYAHYLARSALL